MLFGDAIEIAGKGNPIGDIGGGKLTPEEKKKQTAELLWDFRR